MTTSANPFARLIEVLKHNGYATTPLRDMPGPHFFNVLRKGGWDQAYSGTGRTHILMRLREATRGPRRGIVRLIDFARALETGHARGRSEWVSDHYNALFVVNWGTRGFVTFRPISDR
jgi:hypothetical protein